MLLSTTAFKNISGTYTVVNQNSTDYIDYEVESINGWAVRRFGAISSNLSEWPPQLVEMNFTAYIGWGFLSSVFQYSGVYLRRGIKVPGTERNISYTASGESIVTEKTYGFANNDYLYPKTITIANSDGTSTVTNYTYPKDYVTGSSPGNTVAQGIKLLMDRNVVATVVEEYTTVQPDNIVRSGKFTTFKTTVPAPDQTYELRPITVPNSFSPATITSSANTKSSSYDLKSTINLYDAFGNVRQATDETKGISTVILYSYNGRFPIAVIENSNFTSVAAAISGGQSAIDNFALGYPDNSQVNTFLSTIRTSLAQSFITTYTIDPYLGVTSQTDENGRTVTYQYDTAGRLQLIKDKDGNIVKTFEYKYRQ